MAAVTTGRLGAGSVWSDCAKDIELCAGEALALPLSIGLESGEKSSLIDGVDSRARFDSGLTKPLED
jgi:hypothetical protein